MAKSWAIRVAQPLGHSDWFSDGHMNQAGQMQAFTGTFAGIIEKEEFSFTGISVSIDAI